MKRRRDEDDAATHTPRAAPASSSSAWNEILFEDVIAKMGSLLIAPADFAALARTSKQNASVLGAVRPAMEHDHFLPWRRLDKEGAVAVLSDPAIEQTLELCMAAMRRDGMALEYVRAQTPDICLAAVQQNGLALKHVRVQTYAICMAAVRQNANALDFVRDKQPDIYRAAQAAVKE